MRNALIAASLASVFTLAACSNDSSSDAGNGASAAGSTSTTENGSTTTTGGSGSMNGTDASSATFGSACSSVPATGAGSFEGMAQDPVATAASNNPVLSTLVQAVGEANLVDTLNGTQDITVFAPTNDAFAAVPAKTLKAAMADPSGLLTTVLTYHVVAGRLAPDQLAGDHETLEGDTISVDGSGDSFTVNGDSNVVCGNVQTANATVYIVDHVLMPPMNG